MTEHKYNELRFIGKILVNFDIKLETALHIGGTEEGFDIGGIDNTVIKDKTTGVPYIPGSSLKGKMRSILEWVHNKIKIEKNKNTGKYEGLLCSDPKEPIGIVFGVSAEGHRDVQPGPTRLTVRDAYPIVGQIEKWTSVMGENIYTEAKTENAIDRLTSAANPRTQERVPAGSVFKGQFIFDVFTPADISHLKLLFEGMRLLEDSYLGGGGTRGSGQVSFKNIEIEARDKSFYIGSPEEPLLKIKQNSAVSLNDILNKFDEIFPKLDG
jgi:CRISPR-associated protein Csm3